VSEFEQYVQALDERVRRAPTSVAETVSPTSSDIRSNGAVPGGDYNRTVAERPLWPEFVSSSH